MALDTEADSLHSYFHKVCLIQVSADGHDMVVDPLALEVVDLTPLWEVLEDPGLPLLMHGADYDVRILDRDYGARLRGLHDTQIMAQLLGEARTGLAALLEQELGVTLDKKHQRADWGRRPLSRSQIAYAAADTAYLGELSARLRSRLEALGRWGWAEEEFRALERVRFSAPEEDPLAFERIKKARSLRGAARDRLFSLHAWRDRTARTLDVPPFKVLGNQQLMALAEEAPEDLAELGRIDGIGPRSVRRWGREILRLVRRPERAPAAPKRTREPPLPRAVQRRRQSLTAVRDAHAGALGIQGGLLCSRTVIDAVARAEPPPRSAAELAGLGLEGWRAGVLGPDFMTAIASS
jgi:ribonuclease D